VNRNNYPTIKQVEVPIKLFLGFAEGVLVGCHEVIIYLSGEYSTKLTVGVSGAKIFFQTKSSFRRGLL
jgi:hypothetical protein